MFSRINAFMLVSKNCWYLLFFCVFSVQADVVRKDQQVSDTPLKVVTTFSVLADMVQQIGEKHVKVTSLVDWDEDVHVYQPSPDDVKQIARADLLILNGLGLEGWLARLLSAAGYQGPIVEATKGVELIHLNMINGGHDHDRDHDHQAQVYDPHAWHSLKAAQVYAENIAKGLIQIDAKHEAEFAENLKVFLAKIKNLDTYISSEVAKVPEEKRRMVVPHNAFAYLARDYGFKIHSLQGLSTDSEAGAADLAKIVRLIRALKVNAIFTETISDKRLIRVIEAETDASIEGALVSGALSREIAPSYLEMMQYNTDLMIKALIKN